MSFCTARLYIYIYVTRWKLPANICFQIWSKQKMFAWFISRNYMQVSADRCRENRIGAHGCDTKPTAPSFVLHLWHGCDSVVTRLWHSCATVVTQLWHSYDHVLRVFVDRFNVFKIVSFLLYMLVHCRLQIVHITWF